MVQIKWTLQAKDDLNSIFDYISNDSKNYAKRQILKLKARPGILLKHIRIGRIVPEMEDPRIRELIEGRYRIVYKIVSESQVDILTVHHSSRDF